VSSCICFIFTICYVNLVFISQLNTSTYFSGIMMSHKALYYFKALSIESLWPEWHPICVIINNNLPHTEQAYRNNIVQVSM
jgi:hypothetical protein